MFDNKRKVSDTSSSERQCSTNQASYGTKVNASKPVVPNRNSSKSSVPLPSASIWAYISCMSFGSKSTMMNKSPQKCSIADVDLSTLSIKNNKLLRQGVLALHDANAEQQERSIRFLPELGY